MTRRVEEILEKILLPIDASWKISDVIVNALIEEVEVELKYALPYIDIKGNRYSIYDHRPIRKWRHLDLWQYKTFLSSRLPRYKDEKDTNYEVSKAWRIKENFRDILFM